MNLSTKKLERVIKGFANHSRLKIIVLLKETPELSVEEIAERLHMNYWNASDHIRKLAIAGLVLKRYEGTTVRHKLTDRAHAVLLFCKKLDY
ncbi:MAG: winged helix-turn-helix transcriptional regulator [Parcubacteria group bacterium]|nr:winged helix-turn-helix transcriptional regulator [Parcubacteria group bacterium]